MTNKIRMSLLHKATRDCLPVNGLSFFLCVDRIHSFLGSARQFDDLAWMMILVDVAHFSEKADNRHFSDAFDLTHLFGPGIV